MKIGEHFRLKKRPTGGDGIPAFLVNLLDRARVAESNGQVSQLEAIVGDHYLEPLPAPADPCWCGHDASLHKHLDDCKHGGCDCWKFRPKPADPYEPPGPDEYGSYYGVSDNPFERNK